MAGKKPQKRNADKLVLVDIPTHKKLKMRAAKENTTMGELIKQLVNAPKEPAK